MGVVTRALIHLGVQEPENCQCFWDNLFPLVISKRATFQLNRDMTNARIGAFRADGGVDFARPIKTVWNRTPVIASDDCSHPVGVQYGRQ